MKRKQRLYKPATIGMTVLMTAGLCSCQGNTPAKNNEKAETKSKYQITEENEATEM